MFTFVVFLFAAPGYAEASVFRWEYNGCSDVNASNDCGFEFSAFVEMDMGDFRPDVNLFPVVTNFGMALDLGSLWAPLILTSDMPDILVGGALVFKANDEFTVIDSGFALSFDSVFDDVLTQFDTNGDGVASEWLGFLLCETRQFFCSGPDEFAVITGDGEWGSRITIETSVLEPASLALMSIGLLGIGFNRRKRNR